MTTQPEALRLADVLSGVLYSAADTVSASKELRRLHAENEALRADAKRWRYVVHNCGWIRRNDEDGRYSEMTVRLPYEADQSCVATRTAAIDAARSKT
jgi:hypothetical protein